MKIYFSGITTKSCFFLFIMDLFKVVFWPNLDLLFWAAMLVILDLFTGLIKAQVKGNLVVSSGVRKTLIKLCQYLGVISVCFILSNVAASTKDSDFMGTGLYHKLKFTFQFLNNLVILVIIYAESLSILENGLEINSSSPFSKFFVKPLHKILSLAILGNAIKLIADRAPSPKG